MRSALIGAGALLVCSGFAACSTFSADPDDGLDGGDADVADGVLDTGSTDAGKREDVDASTGKDSACDSVHLFCDDFDDRPAGSTPDWGEAPTIDSNASMKVRGFANALSAPNVVESEAASGSKALLSKTLAVTSPKQGVSCTFAYQVVARNQTASAASIAVMTLRAGAADYEVDLRDDTAITTARGSDGGVQPGSLEPAPTAVPGVWTPVTISMTFGAQGVVAVEIGGTRVSTLMTDPKVSTTTAPTARLDLGVQSFSVGDRWQVLYDDVVCDLLP